MGETRFLEQKLPHHSAWVFFKQVTQSPNQLLPWLPTLPPEEATQGEFQACWLAGRWDFGVEKTFPWLGGGNQDRHGFSVNSPPITFYFPTWVGFRLCSSRLLVVPSDSLRPSVLLVFPIFIFLLQFYMGYFSLKNQLHEHINPFIWRNILFVFCLGRKTQFLILPLCFSPFHSTL